MYLGKFNSPASRQEYAGVIADAEARGVAAIGTAPNTITITEACASFWTHVVKSYKLRSQHFYRKAVRVLAEQCGNDPVAEFGPAKLRALRDRLIHMPYTGRARARYGDQRTRVNVNTFLSAIKGMFRWLAETETVGGSVYHGLLAVRPVGPGQSMAKERVRRKPAPVADVAACLAFMSPTVRAMVDLQMVTGLRAGELCGIRPMDLDMTGPVWRYNLAHKTEAYVGERTISIRPRGQDIIRPFLNRPADAHLFSPAESFRWHLDQKVAAAAAKSPKNARVLALGRAAYAKRSKAAGRRPGRVKTFYTPNGYASTIQCAYRKAERAAHAAHPDVKPDVVLVKPWHSHLIRHRFATEEVRRSGSYRTAMLALGHTSETMTKRYVADTMDDLDPVFVAHY